MSIPLYEEQRPLLLSLLLPTRAAAAAPNLALKLDVPLFREDIVIGVVRIG